MGNNNNNNEKHLHIKLKSEVYHKLKNTCAYEASSIQSFVANMITNNLQERSHNPWTRGKSKEKKINELNILHECSFLKDAPELELVRIADASSVLHFDKGESILVEEDSPDYVYIIIKGMVKIYKLSSNGRRFAIDVLSELDVFGMVSLLSGFTYTSGAQAMENTDLVSIPRQIFLDFIFHNPNIMTQINCLVSARVARLNAKLLDVTTCTADYRLAKVLYELSNKYGNTLRFIHNDIAELSATTNETATRIMTKLKNRGTISITRGTVKILDKENLLS